MKLNENERCIGLNFVFPKFICTLILMCCILEKRPLRFKQIMRNDLYKGLTLYKQRPESQFTLLQSCEDTRKPSPQLNHAGTLLRVSASRIVRNKFLLFINHPIYFFQKPGLRWQARYQTVKKDNSIQKLSYERKQRNDITNGRGINVKGKYI